MNKHLHVVCFDNPYPPNYGGVIDVFYKLKALQQKGINITLHVFEYGRMRNNILDSICKHVYYYPRRTFVNPFIGTIPYIVSTRNHTQLLQNLQVNQYPILFEGLHSCFYLNHPLLQNRKKMVRMHNIEHDYYRKLEDVESNFFKKYFFSKEAERLKLFENILQHAQAIFAISQNDTENLATRYSNVHLLPAFHANTQVTSQSGSGNFAFYHGNLAVGENDEAAKFLANNVFNNINVPLVIAGNNPSTELKKIAEGHAHITLLQNVSTEKINELSREAHINVLPTFQNTGIKLKLINVLYQGRWVVANNMMVENTGLEQLCHIANTADEMKNIIKQLMTLPFNIAQIEQRTTCLDSLFCNQTNAKNLLRFL